jgi:Activator of Hsp90 ATPase homolog 1-like protein
MNPTSASDTIVQEITIKGSAERIFEALTNPDERMKWWGAQGRFQVTHIESDLRPGGKWVMRGIGMGGKPFTVAGEYRKIERHISRGEPTSSLSGEHLKGVTCDPVFSGTPLQMVEIRLSEKPVIRPRESNGIGKYKPTFGE